VHLTASAIVCAVRAHGEHGSIVRVMTEEAGLVAGYVRGGQSRRLRPVLQPGNIVAVDVRARTEDQLGAMTVELTHSRAPLLSEPLAAAGIDWATLLTAVALPEGQGYPQLYVGLSALLDAIELAPAARGWATAMVRYEGLVLSALGYGKALTPTTDLAVALRRNRDAIDRHLLGGPRADDIAAVRERLVARLMRAIGQS
jgi:DNA repair protein RecO (recombination protein O)